ncbi:MAG TPA: hypothetical protein VFL95_07360 [Gemmatimonadales bacterium]|nr:hypothetical protein [Gemmatimonadales bacterium]
MSEFDYSLDPARLSVVRDGALVVPTAPAVFRVAGPGALDCLQGLLTGDLVKPGDDSLVYGALLTPKGMIVVDAWVLRGQNELLLVMPARAREAAAALLQRSLPPRLAQITDLTDDYRALWAVGAGVYSLILRSSLDAVPDGAGRAVRHDTLTGPLWLALAPELAPFRALAVGPAGVIDATEAKLADSGLLPGSAEDLEAARILSGWPALGAEIDERTLPQEVRYDELGGVSYTKGCYTGQETVARVHFRGHPNRELRGLRWSEPGPLESRTILNGEREVGTVRSTLTIGDFRLGLAPIRREVQVGDEVAAAGRPAVVTALPFAALEPERLTS